MSEILTAIYQDGAFIPEQPPSLAAGARVRLVVEPLQTRANQHLTDEFDAISDSIIVHGKPPRMTRDQMHERD